MKKYRGKKERREREERDSATHFDSRIKKIDRKNREVGQGHPARLWSIHFRLSRINLDQRCVIRRAHENGSRVIAVTRNGPFRRVNEKEREKERESESPTATGLYAFVRKGEAHGIFLRRSSNPSMVLQ